MKILHARFFLLNQYFYGINFAANLLILSLIFDKFFLVLSALKRNRSMKRRPANRPAISRADLLSFARSFSSVFITALEVLSLVQS